MGQPPPSSCRNHPYYTKILQFALSLGERDSRPPFVRRSYGRRNKPRSVVLPPLFPLSQYFQNLQIFKFTWIFFYRVLCVLMKSNQAFSIRSFLSSLCNLTWQILPFECLYIHFWQHNLSLFVIVRQGKTDEFEWGHIKSFNNYYYFLKWVCLMDCEYLEFQSGTSVI